MKQLINIVNNADALADFKTQESLTAYVESCGCEGVELIHCPPEPKANIAAKLAVGYHLTFYPDWVGFWLEDKRYIQKHYGSLEAAKQYFSCNAPYDYMLALQQDMDRAEALGAEYCVFHVSDVSSRELLKFRWEHSNEQVIIESANLLNMAMKGKSYHFRLLCENMFTPGLTLENPKQTEYLLEKIDYKNTGIMLDTGHLMCTKELYTESDAIDYVIKRIKEHGELTRYFNGIHLHKSVSGNDICELINKKLEPKGDIYALFEESYAWVLKIDKHEPFQQRAVCKIIDAIAPDYLVHELAAQNFEQKKERILYQKRAFE